MKVFIPGRSSGGILHFIDNAVSTKDIKEADMLLLTGGADVNPRLYGEPRHPRTYFSEDRDEQEIKAIEDAINLDIPMFGICRGAQLLTVMAGGHLIQHVNGHSGIGGHMIQFRGGQKIFATSAHHQMMNPFRMPTDRYEMIAWSAPKLSKVYEDYTKKNIKMLVEPEIIFYPQIRGLAIQSHPEWTYSGSDLAFVSNILIKDYLNVRSK